MRKKIDEKNKLVFKTESEIRKIEEYMEDRWGMEAFNELDDIEKTSMVQDDTLAYI